jgi:hypothetical protein
MPAEIIDAAELVVDDIFYGELPDGARKLFLATARVKYGNHDYTWAYCEDVTKPSLFKAGFSVVREDPALWVRFRDLPMYAEISSIPLEPAQARPFGRWANTFHDGLIKVGDARALDNPKSAVSAFRDVNPAMWCRIEPFELCSSVGKPVGFKKPEFNHTETLKAVLDSMDLAIDIYHVKGA